MKLGALVLAAIAASAILSAHGQPTSAKAPAPRTPIVVQPTSKGSSPTPTSTPAAYGQTSRTSGTPGTYGQPAATSRLASPASPATVQGDPIMKGFDGREWEFYGAPEKTYAVYSDNDHAINMRLFLGEMFDHNGTYIGGVGFQYKGEKVAVSLIDDGDITLTIEDNDIRVGSKFTEGYRKFGLHKSSVTVQWSSDEADLGRAVIVTTDTLQLTVWSVLPGVLDEGGKPQPAYLNFRIALLASPAGDEAQGLIGQTLMSAAGNVPVAESAPTPDSAIVDRTFHGVGEEADYEVMGLFDSDFKFSLFGNTKPIASRKRRFALESIMSHVHFPLVACNGVC